MYASDEKKKKKQFHKSRLPFRTEILKGIINIVF